MGRVGLAALILVFHGMFFCVNAETLRFAPLPMEVQDKLIKQFQPMILLLEHSLDLKIIYKCSNTYSGILEKFRRSQLDLAYLGPLPYVELKALFSHAEPLVFFKEADGKSTYTCALVSFPDNFFDHYNAHQRKIALTQPLSTCGYFAMSGLMHRHGGELEQNFYQYVNTHADVALSVIRGVFDAGAMKTAIAEEYSHLGLQILAETNPFPGFALVANAKTLSPERMALIRQTLISLDPLGKHREQLLLWGENIRHGAVPATDDDYQGVRQLLKEMNIHIPAKGNL